MKRRAAKREALPKRHKAAGNTVEHAPIPTRTATVPEQQELEEEVDMTPQESWLPDEVLFQILYHLARPDLVACRMTCKQWSKVSL